jgi:hypothetical protein
MIRTKVWEELNYYFNLVGEATKLIARNFTPANYAEEKRTFFLV